MDTSMTDVLNSRRRLHSWIVDIGQFLLEVCTLKCIKRGHF